MLTAPEKRIVAIHQPNFFPWLGFFDKINRADVFVLLDNVQFPKKGGSWLNRVRFVIGGKPAWITVPVIRAFHGTRLVTETEIDNRGPWRKKLIKSLEHNYARAPFKAEMLAIVTDVLEAPADLLIELNLRGISRVMDAIGPNNSKLVLGSSLGSEADGTDLLIEQVQAVRGSAYLCGGGASGYQDDDRFGAAGIELVYQEFQHPVYPQGTNEFSPGMSVLDAVAWCGAKGVKEMMNKSHAFPESVNSVSPPSRA